MKNKNNDKLYCPLIHDYCRDDCTFADRDDPSPAADTFCILRFAGMFFSDNHGTGMDYLMETLDGIESQLKDISEILNIR